MLLLSDVHGWAFDQQLHDLVTYLDDTFDFTISYVCDWTVGPGVLNEKAPNFDAYDVIFAPYHRWGLDALLPMHKTLGSLRARWLFPEDKRRAEQREFDLVNTYRAFHVVTRANYDELTGHCPNVVYLTNPINMRRFPTPTQVKGSVSVTWNGNAGHSNILKEDVKGFHSIIVPACRRAGVPLSYAEFHTNRLPPEDMPAFYQQGNVALCASLYEGASSSVMEAMAASQAVIVTDVGNHLEMSDSQLDRYGDTGIIIVERSIDAFEEAIEGLLDDPSMVEEMGRLNRKEIVRAWSWDVWASRFRDFLLTPISSCTETELQNG